MTMNRLKALTAAMLSAAMMVSVAACGTTDTADSGSGDSKTATTGYDVSSIAKDDELAKLVEGNTVKSGELSVGMELSYAPAEFLAEDGKTPTGYDVDLSKAIGKVLGLKTKIVSSMFDTIVPSVGTKYDLGITAMTITKERMDSVDFVSYYRAGSTWTVQKGNPKKIDSSDLCGNKIAVQTGTVQEDEANKIAKQCKADGKKNAGRRSQQAPGRGRYGSGGPARPIRSMPIRPWPATRSPRPTALRRSARMSVSSRRASPSRRATPRWTPPCRKPCRSLWTMART